MPPSMVESTIGPVLGATLLRGLRDYVFDGLGLKTFLRVFLLGVFGAIFVFFCADSATANVWMMGVMRPALHVIGQQLGIQVYTWWEPCSLHQLSRITVSFLGIAGLTNAMYAVTRALLQKRNQRLMNKALRALAEKLVWKSGEEPPEVYRANRKLN